MRKYRVITDEILPAKMNDAELKSSNVFACLSLSNPNFYRGKLTAILKYLSDTFENICLVTTGYLYRYNYTKDIARQKDMFYIMEELANNKVILGNEKFRINTWLDWYVTDEFKHSLSQVETLFINSHKFKEEVVAIAENYALQSNIIDAQDCVQFLLEEFAMIDLLVANGFNLGVYPGGIPPVIASLMRGETFGGGNNFVSNVHRHLRFITLNFKRVGTR